MASQYESQDARASTSGQSSDSELLKQALMNEKAAPDVLQFETDLVSRIEAQIDYQEEQIEMMQESADMELVRMVYTTELARIRYLLRAYLRTRLAKIEQFVMHILDNLDVKDRLSPKEDSYAQGYLVLLGGHLRAAAADHLPPAFASIVRQAAAHPSKDMMPEPDVGRHVFVKVLEDRGSITVDADQNTAEFNKGDLFVIRYHPVRGLLQEGSVQLI